MLLERADAVAATTALLDRVAGGGSGAHFVSGEAGLGKTSLIHELGRVADGRVRLGIGRGHPMDTAIPFGPVVQALDPLGGGVLLTGDGPARDRTSRLHDVLTWLAHSERRPFLLVLDDLHWADPDTLVLISFLCRRLVGLGGVGILATMRPWPSAGHDMAAELAHDGYATVSPLAPLSLRATAALLVERADRRISDDVVERVWRMCGGNPLLVEQVAAVVDRDAAIPELSEGDLPPSLAIVLARFAGLSPPGLRCARAAAVLGPSFLPGVAAEVAQLPEEEVDAALDAIGRTGLVRQGPDGGTEFVHPLFAQALYRDLSDPMRARLHARAFTVLAGRGREAEAAEHAVRAELIGDPLAVGVLERVGSAAHRAGAVGSAADRLLAAVRLAGDRAEPTLLLAAGGMLVDAGRPAEAVTVHQRLGDHPGCPRALRIEALRLLGRDLLYTGNFEQGAARFREACDLAEESHPEAAVEVLLDHALLTFVTLNGPATALPLVERARTIAAGLDAAPGPIDRSSRTELAWSAVALQSGDAGGVEHLSTQIEDLHATLRASPADAGSGIFGPVQIVAFNAVLVERLAEAERLIAAARAAAESRSALEAAAGLTTMHARALAYLGRLDEATTVLRVALENVDVMPFLGLYGSVGLAHTTHYQGDPEQSTGWCDRVEAVAADQPVVLLYVRELTAQRLLREGRPDRAAEVYQRIEETVRRIGIGEPCLVPWARHAVVAHLAAGRRDDAERVVDWLAEHAAALPCRWPRIALATSRAALAEAAGAPDVVDDLFAQALLLHEQVELPIEEIETLLSHGAFLRRSGRPARARPFLATALQMVDDTGARWFEAPLREELALAGGRRRRARREPDRLTAAEHRVARLVVTGLGNREVAAALSLSVHTVEGHLERIYAKTGVHSRGELIARRVVDGGG